MKDKPVHGGASLIKKQGDFTTRLYRYDPFTSYQVSTDGHYQKTRRKSEAMVLILDGSTEYVARA